MMNAQLSILHVLGIDDHMYLEVVIVMPGTKVVQQTG